MSLTREEWVEMWKACQNIRKEVLIMDKNSLITSRNYVISRIKLIEKRIQQVIGQME